MKRLGFSVALMLGVAGLTAEAHAYDHCAKFFVDNSYSGNMMIMANDMNIKNLTTLVRGAGTWDDVISSYSLPKDTNNYSVIQMYLSTNYGGGILQDNSYGGAKSVSSMPSGWNDTISSIKCHVVPMKQVGANP